MTNVRAFAALAAGLVCSALLPAAAQENRPVLRYLVGYMAPTSDYKADLPTGGQLKTVYQDTWGVGLDFEAPLSALVGLDVGIKFFKPSVKVSVPGAEGEKRVKFLPVTLGPMFHFGGETYRLYAGPELVYISYGSFSAPVAPGLPGPLEIKNELTWGAKFGIDVPFSERWVFSGSIEYMDAVSKPDAPGAVDLKPKPVVIVLGAGYRF